MKKNRREKKGSTPNEMPIVRLQDVPHPQVNFCSHRHTSSVDTTDPF